MTIRQTFNVKVFFPKPFKTRNDNGFQFSISLGEKNDGFLSVFYFESDNYKPVKFADIEKYGTRVNIYECRLKLMKVVNKEGFMYQRAVLQVNGNMDVAKDTAQYLKNQKRLKEVSELLESSESKKMFNFNDDDDKEVKEEVKKDDDKEFWDLEI